MTESVAVAVIGAGQAGLSISHELSRASVEHVILERGRVGQSWRDRWDSFCLVLPNWSLRLPGFAYAGGDPDGFMPRDTVVAHLLSYAESFRAPIREEVAVGSLNPEHGRFRLSTSEGEIRAQQVVISSGGFQKPHRPAMFGQFPDSLVVLDAPAYTNPQALPDGGVLIVGSGQTGCQLAEELAETGRDVYVACGRAPWIHRRIEDRDTISWLCDTPFMDQTLADLPSPLARLGANPQASGRGGGHDLHYRTLAQSGVVLLGHLLGVQDGSAHFAPDVNDSVAFGDARYADLCSLIRKNCDERGTRPPEMTTPTPFSAELVETLDLHRIDSVIFTSGFRPDYRSWIECPEAFDEGGFPLQIDGSSTVVEGMHFLGVHFQRNRKSSNFLGIAEDAAVLSERVVARSRG